MSEKTLLQPLCDFVDAGVSTYHVVGKAKSLLEQHGFGALHRGESWNLNAGGRYYCTVNDSAIFAFVIGDENPADVGFKIIAAHTDSPCLKIKPQAELHGEGCVRLNTEVYGGPILSTWFDRPLTLAGRVFLKSADAFSPICKLLHIERPLLMLPNLAIHLDRSVNDMGHPIKRQKELMPILSTIQKDLEQGDYLMKLIADELGLASSDIIDFDLTILESGKAEVWGLCNEFLSAGRLDDLAMSHAGLEAICSARPGGASYVLALFDNEEVGSGTKQGAGSPVLANMLKRIVLSAGGDEEKYLRALEHSFMISADMAHAVHPNYPEKHDPVSKPKMNQGPVIKINANQKYITDGQSAAVFKVLCAEAGVPCQEFVNHSEVVGGSTLGNVLLAQMDIKGVDVGNPMWGMHSIRETVGVKDHLYMCEVFKQFWK